MQRNSYDFTEFLAGSLCIPPQNHLLHLDHFQLVAKRLVISPVRSKILRIRPPVPLEDGQECRYASPSVHLADTRTSMAVVYRGRAIQIGGLSRVSRGRCSIRNLRRSEDLPENAISPGPGRGGPGRSRQAHRMRATLLGYKLPMWTVKFFRPPEVPRIDYREPPSRGSHPSSGNPPYQETSFILPGALSGDWS